MTPEFFHILCPQCNSDTTPTPDEKNEHAVKFICEKCETTAGMMLEWPDKSVTLHAPNPEHYLFIEE